ncbi:hypothetical protein GT370_10555 [Acidocella sp. MX-AZ03]|nr:hypothetical protein [Acidocella sp. MX-AZ03]WBO57767.1 hypothetical protein GT370_10555 [Acidocella sp. MX-AZ03]
MTRTLRASPSRGDTVIFEVRPSPALKTVAAKPRTASTSPAQEWLSFGFNCGGAALAWVGVVGTAATAPVTGGQSLWGTSFLWGGAVASTASCSVSVFRVGAMLSGHENVNTRLDNSGAYVWTMRGLDVVALLGAKGAITDIMEADATMKETGVTWQNVFGAQMSRPQRLRVTQQLALQGAKRVSTTKISSVIKLRLLSAVSAGIGMAGSALTGSTHDLIIWISSPPDK